MIGLGLAFGAGVLFGVFLMALMNIASDADIHLDWEEGEE